MKKHEDSGAFMNARLRLATVDKMHWSLFAKKHTDFAANLTLVIVDEAHRWAGYQGLSLRCLLQRARIGVEMLSGRVPLAFLASATLPKAKAFASGVTGLPENAFTLIEDEVRTTIDAVACKDLPKVFAAAESSKDLTRVAVFLDDEDSSVDVASIAGLPTLIDDKAPILTFLGSRADANAIAEKLRAKAPRSYLVYHSALPPHERRATEGKFLAGDLQATTILATNALEVGIDIHGLDAIHMSALADRASDNLQQIGRCGRTSGRPGLGLVQLGSGVRRELLVDHPVLAFQMSEEALRVPDLLDGPRLRAALLLLHELRDLVESKGPQRDKLERAIKQTFDVPAEIRTLAQRLTELTGIIADIGDLRENAPAAWLYGGFRLSASQGKRTMKTAGPKGRKVATFDDMSLFRDAHPEGVYLSHTGERWRVIGYDGKWQIGRFRAPNESTELGKWLRGLASVIVEPAPADVITRGNWVDEIELFELRDLPIGCATPKIGKLGFGLFDCTRRFDGYRELDAASGDLIRRVELAEVSARFKARLAAGGDGAFLPPYTYRTVGFTWSFESVGLAVETLPGLGPMLGPLLGQALALRLECNTSDLSVAIDATGIRVIDPLPGGSGLAELTLTSGALEKALLDVGKVIKRLARRKSAYEKFIKTECQTEPSLSASELIDACASLGDAWKK